MPAVGSALLHAGHGGVAPGVSWSVLVAILVFVAAVGGVGYWYFEAQTSDR